MRVLVLGGTSFIGPSVVRQLVEAGHDVTLFNRGQSAADLPDGIGRITGNRAEIGSYRDQFSDLQADVVLDMYAMSREDAQLANDALTGIAGRMVAISSLDTFQAFGRLIGTEPGPPVDLPLTEESPVREKRYPYRGDDPRADDDVQRWRDSYDKLDVEDVVLGNPEMPGTILRLPMVYGPRDRQHRFRSFVRRMDDGRSAIPLAGSMAGWRSSWAFVDDIAAAAVLAATDDRAAGRTYVLSETEHPTMGEIARTLADMVGWRGEIISVPDEEMPPTMNLAQDLVADSSRIRQELGYREVTPRDAALQQTIGWERTGGPEMDTAELDYDREDELIRKYG